MTRTKKIWISWGVLYLICTLCGFFSAPDGVWYGVQVLLSLGFFVPPVLLVYHGVTQKSIRLLKAIRLLSILSLSLTLGMILVNFLAINASSAWGKVLYWLLIVVSTPMICSQAWVIGLFGWACLLMASITYLKKT